jgi:Pgp3 C-terminal domain
LLAIHREFVAVQKFTETLTAQRSNGLIAPAPGATATIYIGGGMTLATLYEDDESTTMTNPLTADASGFVQCKLANGKYDIVFSNGAGSVTVDGYVAFDPADGGIVGQEVVGDTASVITCSTPLPVDDTIPQNTEGTQVVTVAITPQNAGSVIEISYNASGSSSTGMFVGAAVFQDSTANALAGSPSLVQTTGNDQKFALSWKFKVAAVNTTARTYKLRLGPDSTGTAYVNGDGSGNRLLGGDLQASIGVREILP